MSPSVWVPVSGAALIFGCSRAPAPETGTMFPKGSGSADAPRQSESQPPREPGKTSMAPSAVVELFTSEGCSSCPLADEVLAAMTDDADRKGARTFTLELHVDYWNDLGWVDPFSSPLHSDRQRAYTDALGSGIYTPQMIVNGREELVGSRGEAARSAVARALATSATVGVHASVRRVDGEPRSFRVEYRVMTERPVDLQIAVAEDAITTNVRAGENAGRTLRHRHVVRSFATRYLAESASGEFAAPWPATRRGVPVVIVYATDPKTNAVLGADAAPAG